MHPVPCAHCGNNFMRRSLDPETPRLCNNCLVREEKRNPKKEKDMHPVVKILIECPIESHKSIEEECINRGINMTDYFMGLHYEMKEAEEEIKKISNHPRPILMGKMEEVEDPKLSKKSGKK